MSKKTAELMCKHITTTFVDLMKTKAFSKITVKQICELAAINRNTFYHHFEDKYGLLSSLFQKIFENFFQQVDLDKFKITPFTIIKDLAKIEYGRTLEFQMKDQEFSQLFNSACFEQLFLLSNDNDFIWLLGKMYVIIHWNELRTKPYDIYQDYRVLDNIIKTNKFPQN